MSRPTKTEERILKAAFHWANNPTDREAKRELWAAVRADEKAIEKRRVREGEKQ